MSFAPGEKNPPTGSSLNNTAQPQECPRPKDRDSLMGKMIPDVPQSLTPTARVSCRKLFLERYGTLESHLLAVAFSWRVSGLQADFANVDTCPLVPDAGDRSTGQSCSDMSRHMVGAREGAAHRLGMRAFAIWDLRTSKLIRNFQLCVVPTKRVCLQKEKRMMFVTRKGVNEYLWALNPGRRLRVCPRSRTDLLCPLWRLGPVHRGPWSRSTSQKRQPAAAPGRLGKYLLS